MSALHFRDAATFGTHAAWRCSRRGLPSTWVGSQQITLLEVAALLHDMGKIGVPDNILFSRG